MLTASDCRKKAAECIRFAEAAADRKTREDYCRNAHAWMTLAEHVERDKPLRPLSPAPLERPVDLLRRNARPIDVIDAAEVLRRRLRLTEPEDALFDSDLFD